MRVATTILVMLGGLLGGCTEDSQQAMALRAAALAKTIAEEGDHVTAAELSDWIIKDRRDFELVDIREVGDFEQGHIPQARHVPLAGLLSEGTLATLPRDRKVVVYSNGTAHAAQAALLLRLVNRDAYALLGGFNYWQAYLNDPASAGADAMDPGQRARYQAVACFFAGDYVADAGLVVSDRAAAAAPPGAGPATPDPLGLGLDLGLGSAEVKQGRDAGPEPPRQRSADPLGLGLELGLGGEAAQSLRQEAGAKPQQSRGRLLIKAEC